MIVIHGAIDGHSRLIVFLIPSSNNKTDTVLQIFLNAVQKYNLTSCVRTARVSTFASDCLFRDD